MVFGCGRGGWVTMAEYLEKSRTVGEDWSCRAHSSASSGLERRGEERREEEG